MAISITTLSGGNTPADGSDPRTFPAIWNSTATQLEGVATDLDTLEASAITGTITSAVEGESVVYDGSEFVNGFPYLLETSEQTADYTLVLADAGKVVNMNKSGAATLTIPTNASVAFPIGTVIRVYNQSADDVTVAGDSGVTVRNEGTVGQYAEASCRKRATDEWVMVGG